MSHPRSPFPACGAAALLAGALALPGCGDAPTRITPATLTPDEARRIERDLDAAAAAEKPVADAGRE